VAVCAAGEKAPCAKELSGVTAIAGGGESHSASYALLGGGTVMDWGDGSWSELGDGSTQSSFVPVAVINLNKAQGIAAGDEQGFAFGPFPTVTAIRPKGGPNYGGTSVSITGSNFSEVSAVRFGSANAKSFTVNSESSITAVSPAGSATVDVTVTTAAGASGASSADQFSYEKLPELGRCVKLTTKKGVYTAGSCITQAAEHNGAYEWEPGPGTRRGFSGESTAPKLETVGKHIVQCATGNFVGEWIGAKAALVKLLLAGCTTISGGKYETCQTNPTEAAEIRTEPVETELGFITTAGTVPKVGLDLKLPKGPSPSVLTFTCGSGPPPVGERWTVEGSAIGGATPVNLMKPIFDPLYRAVGGKQIPEHFEGQANDTLLVSRLDASLTNHEEQAGLTMPGVEKRFFELANEEPLEIKVK
jgi:hypothetical protein